MQLDPSCRSIVRDGAVTSIAVTIGCLEICRRCSIQRRLAIMEDVRVGAPDVQVLMIQGEKFRSGVISHKGIHGAIQNAHSSRDLSF